MNKIPSTILGRLGWRSRSESRGLFSVVRDKVAVTKRGDKVAIVHKGIDVNYGPWLGLFRLNPGVDPGRIWNQ